jgi:hypothetical protein
VHRCGDEAAWWRKAGIDPTVTARTLWLETHQLPSAAPTIGADGAGPIADVGPGQSTAERDRPISTRGANYNMNPIIAAGE